MIHLQTLPHIYCIPGHTLGARHHTTQHTQLMKKLILLAAVLTMMSTSATADGLFRRHHTRTARVRKAPVGTTVNYLDEGAQLSDDGQRALLRYVYAYNSAGERSSETVYIRERNDDGTWGEERYLDRGNYQYEYNTKKQVVCKTVRYEQDDQRYVESYRIMATYGPETTRYDRYTGDDFDYHDASWECWNDNGQLASTTTYDYSTAYTTRYNRDGLVVGTERRDDYDTVIKSTTGTLNDSIFTETSQRGGNWYNATTHVVYSPTAGRLTLLENLGTRNGYFEEGKDEWTYDDHGRLLTWLSYDTSDEGDAGIITRTAADFTLSSDQRFTYQSDEAYAIDNPWRAVFGFHGPIKEMTNVYTDSEIAIHERATFVYNDKGLLTAINYTTDGPAHSQFEVDDKGHIVKGIHTSDSYGDNDTITYQWEGDLCVAKHADDCTTTYTYKPGAVTINEEYNNRTLKISERDGVYKVSTEGDIWRDGVFVRAIQKEDISFLRPNLLADIAGFSPDTMVVVSQKGRVVVSSNIYGSKEYGCNFDDDPFDEEWYVNTPPSQFFTVAHEGEQTICYDIDERPKYILEGGRLVKEYVWDNDEYVSATPDVPTRAALPTGQAYQEISYTYNDRGQAVGMTLKEVDSEGNVSSELNVNYVYNAELGLETVASARQGMTLTGRTLRLTAGGTFSVHTLDGRTLATDARQYHFSKSGTYIITTPTGSMKLVVR